PCSGDHLDLRSFPTRRSSDLFLAALVSLEEARLEVALAVLRHPQLEGAQPGLERAPLPTISPPPPRRRALPGASAQETLELPLEDRKSTRLNSSHVKISYAVF